MILYPLLPTAEIICTENKKPDTYSPKESKLPEKIKTLMLVLWLLSFPFCFYFDMMALLIMECGLGLGIASFISADKLKINGQTARLYTSFIVYELSMFIFVMGLAVFLATEKNKKSDIDKASEIFGIVFFSALAIAIICKLIFLIIKTAVISKRKKKCTEIVTATHYTYIDPWGVTTVTASPISEVGCPVFRYFYHGELYKFAIIQNVPAFQYKNSSFEVFIDPNKPEHFYSDQVIVGTRKQFMSLLKATVFLAAVCAAIIAILFHTV